MRSSLPDLLHAMPVEGVPLDTLADLANRALDEARIAVDDGRASDRLDGRTLRFYQSLAILPKPVYEGRRALYGREHLVRAVAAKQLQSEGYSLSQIQSALPSQSTDDLLSALLEALGGIVPSHRQASPQPVARLDARTPRVLITHELAPGVLVTIDPARVTEPASLLAALSATLANGLATGPSLTRPEALRPDAAQHAAGGAGSSRPPHPSHGEET